MVIQNKTISQQFLHVQYDFNLIGGNVFFQHNVVKYRGLSVLFALQQHLEESSQLKTRLVAIGVPKQYVLPWYQPNVNKLCNISH